MGPSGAARLIDRLQDRGEQFLRGRTVGCPLRFGGQERLNVALCRLHECTGRDEALTQL
jgi:hypothetical protein